MGKSRLLLTSSLLFLLTFSLYSKELINVILITRHGDRTPFLNIVNADYKWDTALSELTPIGMNQEFKLGEKLRKTYIEQLNFLPSDYQSLSIYTLSSCTNRTFESAECLLMGLYPLGTGPKLKNGKDALPGTFQPIPIMTLDENSKLIMFPYPEYLEVLKKYVYNTEIWTNKEKSLQTDFKNWTSILGNKITCLADVISIGDVLIVAKAHNKPSPKGLSETEAGKIIELTSWGLSQQFKSQKVSYILGELLVNRIIKNLEDSASGKSKYKLIYYSGHDLTLLQIMGTLGVPLQEAPRYAANIIIELYKDGTNYTVMLKYNDQYIKLPIMDKNNKCSLKELTDYIAGLNKKYSNLKIK